MLRFKLERRPLAPTQPERIPWLRRLRRRVFRMVHQQRFDNLISVCILISVLLMLCSHFNASDTFLNVTEGVNAVLSLIFLCEALLKLFGLVRLNPYPYPYPYPASPKVLTLCSAAAHRCVSVVRDHTLEESRATAQLTVRAGRLILAHCVHAINNRALLGTHTYIRTCK